jgi:hypothetical protein
MTEEQKENSGISPEILDFIKKQHIHFLLPMYGGQCSEATFTALMKFVIIATKLGINYTVDITSNESLITRGRNNLVSKFMCNKAATHLMFIDSDIGFDAEAIFRLLLSNQDVVGGAYPMKSLPIKYVLNKVSNPVTDGKDLIEVSTLGTGFLMVKRHVIEKMIEAHPHLKYKDSLNFGKECEKFMYALFDTMIDPDGHYLSEDWTFCYRWRQMGGRVFVNSSVKLDHTGYYKFCGDTDQLKKTFEQMVENISSNKINEERE